MISLFRSSRKAFRVYYYMSSLLPIYLFIVVFMVAIRFNINDINIFLRKVGILTSYKIVFYIFLLLLVISAICLFITKGIITDTKQYSKTFGTTKVFLKNEYNQGFREFILSVILPMMSTFSINENPVPTLIMILVFQLLIYIFFVNSSDFFPNIPLVLLGYSVFTVNSDNDNSKLKFIFGKTKNIDKIISGNCQFEVVEIGEPEYSNNIGVICE